MLRFHIEVDAMGFTWEQEKMWKIEGKLTETYDIYFPSHSALKSPWKTEGKRRFSNCLSHQNHFNEHNMHNRSFRIIIIFLRLSSSLHERRFTPNAFKLSDDWKKGFFIRIFKRWDWNKNLVVAPNPPSSRDNFWYMNVEKVPCVHNEIIKMSPNMFSISRQSPPCFMEEMLLFGEDLFSEIHCESLLNDSHVSLGFAYAIVYKNSQRRVGGWWQEFMADRSQSRVFSCAKDSICLFSSFLRSTEIEL